MIKLKYSDLRSNAFNNVINRLAQMQGLDVRTSYQFSKILYKVGQEQKIAQPLFMKLVNQYAQKDEKGKLVPLKDGDKEIPGTFVIPEENQATWDAEYEKFMNLEFTIDRRQIHLEELENAKLSANDILSIGDIVTEDPLPSESKLVAVK